MTYPSFSDFLRELVGRNWVLARRSARIVDRYGEDVRCLSQKQHDALRAEWVAAHPATAMASTLPDNALGDWIRQQVRQNLEYGFPPHLMTTSTGEAG